METENSEIQKTMDLLREGEEKIEFPSTKDIILILGNTGAGKSTTTGWLLEENRELEAIESIEGSNDFLIYDNDQTIGNSTTRSSTVFPRLLLDKDTNEVYYDCPGFSDTRSSSHEIAITYFIKKLIDYAERVKIILVVNYSSVRKGVDRCDFMKLMRHCTDLIKDVNKYKDSISILVTKVDNQYRKVSRGLELIPDYNVQKSIVDFLREVKRDNDEDRNITNLINILCTVERENFTRIGLFRRPDESGPIFLNELLMEGRIRVQEIIRKNLFYTEKRDEDFGYTISEKSENDINDLVQKIGKKISLNFEEITIQIKESYYAKIDEVKTDLYQTEPNSSSISKMENLVKNLFQACSVFEKLANELKQLKNLENLSQKIQESISKLGFENPEHQLENIREQVKFLKFLQVVSKKELKINPSDWLVDLQKLKEIKSNILELKAFLEGRENEKKMLILREKHHQDLLQNEKKMLILKENHHQDLLQNERIKQQQINALHERNYAELREKDRTYQEKISRVSRERDTRLMERDRINQEERLALQRKYEIMEKNLRAEIQKLHCNSHRGCVLQ